MLNINNSKEIQSYIKSKGITPTKRIDTCWFCGRQVACDITVLKSGEEIPCCDTCYEEEKANAEYIDPMDLI